MRIASLKHVVPFLVAAVSLGPAASLSIGVAEAATSTGGARAASTSSSAPAGTGSATSGSATSGSATSGSGTSASGTEATEGGASPGTSAPGSTSRKTLATWYGPGFYGHTTACGQKMSPTLVGVASRKLACGTLVRFGYRGHELTVPVLDRGPYGHIGATWDLTAGAARALTINETVHVAAQVVGSLPNSTTLGEPPAADPLSEASAGGTAASGGEPAGNSPA